MSVSVEMNGVVCRLADRLLPKPDEVERVLQAAVGSIGERLGKGLPEGVAAYWGRA